MAAGATVFVTMKTGSKAWEYRQYRNQDDEGRADEISRLLHMYNARIDLVTILERSEDEEIRSCAGNALVKLEHYFDACEKVIARHEARGEWDAFRLRHRMLAGLAVELSHLAEREPEQGSFRPPASAMTRNRIRDAFRTRRTPCPFWNGAL